MKHPLPAIVSLVLLATTAGAWNFDSDPCLLDWTVTTTNGGTVTCSTTVAWEGTRSLRIDSPSFASVAHAQAPPGSIDGQAAYEISLRVLRPSGGTSPRGIAVADTGQVSLLNDEGFTTFRDAHGWTGIRWFGWWNQWHDVRIFTDPVRERYSVVWDGELIAVGVPFRTAAYTGLLLGDDGSNETRGSLFYDAVEIHQPPRTPAPAYAIQEVVGILPAPSPTGLLTYRALNGTTHVRIPLVQPAGDWREVVMLEYGPGVTGSAYAEVWFEDARGWPVGPIPGQCENYAGYGLTGPLTAPHGRPQRCMAWPGAEVAVVLAREGIDVPFRFTYAYPLE